MSELLEQAAVVSEWRRRLARYRDFMKWFLEQDAESLRKTTWWSRSAGLCLNFSRWTGGSMYPPEVHRLPYRWARWWSSYPIEGSLEAYEANTQKYRGESLELRREYARDIISAIDE